MYMQIQSQIFCFQVFIVITHHFFSVDVLLKHGADPNQLDVNGNTAFHLGMPTSLL